MQRKLASISGPVCVCRVVQTKQAPRQTPDKNFPQLVYRAIRNMYVLTFVCLESVRPHSAVKEYLYTSIDSGFSLPLLLLHQRGGGNGGAPVSINQSVSDAWRWEILEVPSWKKALFASLKAVGAGARFKDYTRSHNLLIYILAQQDIPQLDFFLYSEERDEVSGSVRNGYGLKITRSLGGAGCRCESRLDG